MLASSQLVLKHLGVDTRNQGVKIVLGGDLCAVSGIGASAANCVSLARALSVALDLGLSEEAVNRAGYIGEQGYHGTPSGIDNTASTYGGLLKFTRTHADPLFETKSLKSACRIVYASTGLTASTTEVVGDVRAKKDKDPLWYQSLQDRYLKVFTQAEVALEEGDWERVGALASENHVLLQELGVSCEELDALVEAALKAGAAGAKLAGTGRGGLMFAITPDEETQDKVFKALSQVAPMVWKTSFL